MAIDTRDWYIKKLRKLTGYKERAEFRVNLKEREYERGWKNLAKIVLLFVAIAVAMLLIIRTLFART